jgi:hypothetical protein
MDLTRTPPTLKASTATDSRFSRQILLNSLEAFSIGYEKWRGMVPCNPHVCLPGVHIMCFAGRFPFLSDGVWFEQQLMVFAGM